MSDLARNDQARRNGSGDNGGYLAHRELMIVNREDVKTLLLAADRAEKAEALLSRLQQAVATYDVSLRRSDVDFAVEIIGEWLGDAAVLGFGVDSTLAVALATALTTVGRTGPRQIAARV